MCFCFFDDVIEIDNSVLPEKRKSVSFAKKINSYIAQINKHSDAVHEKKSSSQVSVYLQRMKEAKQSKKEKRMLSIPYIIEKFSENFSYH